jgi:hypothetical protein
VAWRINEIELVVLAIIGFVIQADCVGFDRNATLAFEVHAVEDLLHHFALRESSSVFEQAICERGFTVINVRNDAEIAYETGIHVDEVD